MITKEVKEYSKRLRINIVKNDGLDAGDKVVIFKEDDYVQQKENIKNIESQLRTAENKLQNYESQQENLEEMIKKVTSPIEQNYEKQLQDKDKQIGQLTDELNALKKVCNQFNIDILGLSTVDIVFRKKHKQLIDDFNNSIWITGKDDKIVDADAKALPNNEK